MRQTILYTVAFLTGFAMMGFEILGVRVLTPYYGSSVYVWGAIIAVILTGLSIGYAAGGNLADRLPGKLLLPWFVLLPAILIMLFPLYGYLCCDFVSGFNFDARWGALLLAVKLFLVPCIFMGAVLPVVIKMLTAASGKVGSSAGFACAASTAGSIAGTLFTSFFLITWISVSKGIVLTGALLMLCFVLSLGFLGVGKSRKG